MEINNFTKILESMYEAKQYVLYNLWEGQAHFALCHFYDMFRDLVPEGKHYLLILGENVWTDFLFLDSHHSISIPLFFNIITVKKANKAEMNPNLAFLIALEEDNLKPYNIINSIGKPSKVRGFDRNATH